MGGLFSKKKAAPSQVSEHDRSVLQLKHQRDELKKYSKRIQIQMEKDRTVAKELIASGKKDKALLLLRKKRRQETLLDRTTKELENLEQLVQDIEFAQIQSQVVKGLESGNKALKELHSFLSLERVEQVMDETAESVQYQKEIDELISGKLTEEDEDACETELEELLGGLEALPDAPSEAPEPQKEVERPHPRRDKAELVAA